LRPSTVPEVVLESEKKGFQKLTAFQYTLIVSIIATLFLSWFTFENWELLVGASLLTFWAALLGIMVIVFPLYSVRLGKYALIIAFGLGYLSDLCGFSPMWMFAFSIVIFIAPAGHFKVSSSCDSLLSFPVLLFEPSPLKLLACYISFITSSS
jgi:hypothetical protein